MRSIFALAAAVISVFTGADVALAESADRKLIQYLHIAPKTTNDTHAIEAAILKEIPIGSTSADVLAKMEIIGIASDKQVRRNGDAKSPRIIYQINYDVTSFDLVKTSYDLDFQMDSTSHLKSVQVRRYLTGL